jgi:hypothetical protein
MADTDPTEVSLGEPVPRRGPGRRIAVALGAVAVVAGGVFAAASLGSDSNGPEDPVRAMLAAAEKGDVLGVMDQLDPGERDALREPFTDLVDELNRLDVLHDADLADVGGVELEVSDLELSSDVVRDDVARVRIDDGKATTSVDPKDLPLGGFIEDLGGDDLRSDSSGDTTDLSTGDDFIATVKRGGRWYVSIGYTIAEQAREQAHATFDEMGPGITPAGADSPEDAVRRLVDAGVALDAKGVVALLSPHELGALQDYAGLWTGGIEGAEPDAEITVSKLDLDSTTSGDRGTVFVRDAVVEGSGDGATFRYADGCLDITEANGVDPETGEEGPQHQQVCNGADPFESLKSLGSLGLGDVEPPKLSFEGKQAELGIAVERVDGKWYVSPVRTVLDGLVAELRLFQRDDLTKLKDYVSDVFGSFASSFETGFDACVEGSSATTSIPDEGGASSSNCGFGFGEEGELPVPTTTTAP